MKGYISYTDNSPLSLSYKYPDKITIRDKIYTTAKDAILDGQDPDEVSLIHVAMHGDVYLPYRYYILQGEYDDYLNKAIADLLIPKREITISGKYMIILDARMNKYASSIPKMYSIPVIRNVFLVNKIRDNLYVETSPLDVTEEYSMYLIKDVSLYVGDNGSFLLLDKDDQDTTLSIQEIQRLSGLKTEEEILS